jgi:hypothetical protein
VADDFFSCFATKLGTAQAERPVAETATPSRSLRWLVLAIAIIVAVAIYWWTRRG